MKKFSLVLLTAILLSFSACGSDSPQSIKTQMEEAKKEGYFTREQVEKKQNVRFWEETIDKIDKLLKDQPKDAELQKMRLEAGKQLSVAKGEGTLDDIGNALKAGMDQAGKLAKDIGEQASKEYKNAEEGVRLTREAREQEEKADQEGVGDVLTLDSSFGLREGDAVEIGWKFVNVRAHPRLSAEIMDKLHKGQSAVVQYGPFEKDGHKWWLIKYGADDRTGYCVQDALTLRQ